MLIDLKGGFMWWRMGRAYKFYGSLDDGKYYWKFPFCLDVRFYTETMAF